MTAALGGGTGFRGGRGVWRVGRRRSRPPWSHVRARVEQLLADVRDVVVFARAAIGAPGVPRAIGTIWLAERGEAARPRERVDHACFMLTHKWWVVVVMCQMRIEKYGVSGGHVASRRSGGVRG